MAYSALLMADSASRQAFAGAVGICAAGAAGKVVMTQVQKKKTESMRSMLSSQAGIEIDASILDEVL